MNNNKSLLSVILVLMVFSILTSCGKQSVSDSNFGLVIHGGAGTISRDKLTAEQEQSYIAIWPDRSALFNNPSPAKNPYRGDAFGYEANPKTLPPVGTPITLRATRVDS